MGRSSDVELGAMLVLAGIIAYLPLTRKHNYSTSERLFEVEEKNTGWSCVDLDGSEVFDLPKMKDFKYGGIDGR